MNAQVQAYLDKAPHDFQQLLLHYSSLIHSQFDEVEERMGRGMIYYKLHSKPLCSLGHFAKHLTFFPMGTQVISDFLPRLEGFHTTKGGVHCTPERPIPDEIFLEMIHASYQLRREEI